MSGEEEPCVSFAAEAVNRQIFLGTNSESESAVTPDRLSFQAMPRQLFMVALVLLCIGVGLRSAAAQPDPKAYVANSGSNDVSVIDTSTNAVVATVPVGTCPSGVAIAITSSTIFAYVTNQGSNNVSVINTASNTVIATVSVGFFPAGIAITPDGAHAYVANQASNTVSVVSTATNTVTATIGVGFLPNGVAITPDGTRAYVTNQASNTVSVIRTSDNSVIATVDVSFTPSGIGITPTGIAITPDGFHAYVTNQASNTVSVISTSNNSVIATVDVSFTPAGMGLTPVGVAITPDGAFAYVANSGSDNVSVVSTATNTVTATVPVFPVGIAPNRIAISSDGSTAYVTNSGSNNVSVIDTATNTVITNVSVGSAPMGIAITMPPSGSGGGGGTQLCTNAQSFSITANFNNKPIAANNFIWFNSKVNPNGPDRTPVTIHFTHQTITSGRFNLTVPDATITFDPKATSATTTFTGDQWITIVPSKGIDGEAFLSGLSYQVPADLPGGIKNVKWSGSFSSDTAGVKLDWKWSAAVYTHFSSDNNQLQVKPVKGKKASLYPNSDEAGTPEGSYFCGTNSCTFKSAVIAGATGEGGHNYTGSDSKTGKATPCLAF
jgi:YVTN family beta-propeller protein